MQTIARANRVASYRVKGHSGDLVEKKNGEIVDYYNVFRNMRKALKDYAQGADGEEPPVQEKSELFELLDDAVAQTLEFCRERDIELNSVFEKQDTFKNIDFFNQAADTLLSNDDWRKQFNVYENTVTALYEACKPEIFQQHDNQRIAAIQYLRGVVDALVEQADIDEVSQKISELLDESVVVDNAEAFNIKEHRAEYEIVQKGQGWDLSKINYDKLREDFKKAEYKHIEIAELRAFIEDKLQQLLVRIPAHRDHPFRLNVTACSGRS
jgi:type I restriction enzyme R subunit